MSEIGGDFHWTDAPLDGFMPWPEPHVLFGTARASVLAVARHQIKTRLWLPVYFCPHTRDYWRRSGLDIIHYSDHPILPHPDWTTLTPRKGDMVIAVDYFGVRSPHHWLGWQDAHPGVILLEDHTHDPLSGWARFSKADYAFASLRKTFPAPDGAIVWSPARHSLPSEPEGRCWSGSALKMAAMIWKSEYIHSRERDTIKKDLFRRFQIDGEDELSKHSNEQVAPWTRELLRRGFPVQWRNQREQNVRSFLEQLSQSKCVRPLFNSWPQNHCPFNPVLITNTPTQRDDLRSHLIAAKIYPPVHWKLTENSLSEAHEIASRVLTLPVDHRCTYNDIKRILTVLESFLNNQCEF